MPAVAHRVRTQRWRVAARSAGEAFTLRARLRAAMEDELLPVFGRAFDEAVPGDTLLHIPRLELRLRVASLDALAGALAEALGEALRRQAHGRPASPPRPAASAAREQRLSVLLGYLESGALAWHAAHLDAASIASELRAALLANLSRVVPRRSASFAHATRYYFRLLQLLPAQRWLEVAALLEDTAGPRSSPAADTPETEDFVAGLPALREHPEAEWPPLLARVLAGRGVRAAIALLVAGSGPAIARHDALRVAAALLAAAATRLEPPGIADRGTRAARASTTHRVEAQGDTALPAPDAPRAGQREAALMATNVGLVLLHPFLPQLFGSCGFLRKQDLGKPERAAALLHWLATGRDEVFEFELGFVKLLLGLRPEAPLAVGEGLLGARERQEGEALLNAVLGHWKRLGNTTPEALRVAFLQRRGALREADDGWRLQPESESYDVLLGHLPWGFATVKLPWMTRPLFTDWPTP